MGFNVVLVGAQWGDEGKGKIVDVLAEFFDIVARYQGGSGRVTGKPPACRGGFGCKPARRAGL